MEKNGADRLSILGLYACFAAFLLFQSECVPIGKHLKNSHTKPTRKLLFSNMFDVDMPLDSSNTDDHNTKSYHPDCAYTPLTPTSPSTVPSPMGYTPPTPSGFLPPSPSGFLQPSPFSFPPSGPIGKLPNPTPSGFVPYPNKSPPTVYPPPSSTVPSPTSHSPPNGQWCVAKASAPDLLLQTALDYACGPGADSDCARIQPGGQCFSPNTLHDHASYAFNSYWQKAKAIGGTCDFGGTAELVSANPSHDGCQFI